MIVGIFTNIPPKRCFVAKLQQQNLFLIAWNFGNWNLEFFGGSSSHDFFLKVDIMNLMIRKHFGSVNATSKRFWTHFAIYNFAEKFQTGTHTLKIESFAASVAQSFRFFSAAFSGLVIKISNFPQPSPKFQSRAK